MFAYLKTLSPDDRAKEIAAIEKLLQQDPTALVPLYRDAALQNTSRNVSESMVLSITGISVGAIFAGAFVGFPLALTAGTLFLAQQFWNGQRQKREARWAIEDGDDFVRYLDKETQREYKHFAAAVKDTSGHVLPHSEPAIDVLGEPVPDRPRSLSMLDMWVSNAPNPEIRKLPLNERGQYIVDRLIADGFRIDRAMSGSVIVVAGSQRGGKGTLLALLCILQQALTKGETAIRYYTAGNDIYPFKTLKTVCSDSFPSVKDKDEANRLVAAALNEEIQSYRQCENYERQGEMLVIDEAIALALITDPETNRQQASYLLRQFAKSGGTCIVVLHASNLTAWVGNGNTAGLAQAFKSGVTLIGCRSKAMATKGLQSTNVATGEYFFADPENFGIPLKDSPALGKLPDWLLKVKHPGNGAPDPARSLLAFFPEMISRDVLKMEPTRFQPMPPPTVSEPKTIPAQTDAERLETLFNKGSEDAVRADLASVFEFIKMQIPNAGNSLSARDLYRSTGASSVGITKENAVEFMQKLADADSARFSYEEKANNAGSVSRFIKRLKAF
ncbi:hypothetical protein H6F86_00415 [Phormidium sp. FACHB-592]|uniref:FtsK domain-containing protein n=1 Tax=Stenomitos frigidus AS-A4 TaxID=2933935 RepID=A0ABV0KTL5_9CYAN|nr:hypothetical protein [Phormidium sp. FACHB-592]MBD2072397.1 hypothetical protein [Phormidium sp. FACHB-592]